MNKLKNRVSCLFNCTTNNVGGGMKNSALFVIESLKQDSLVDWIYAVSPGVVTILKSKNIEIDHRFTVFPISPARNNAARRAIRHLAINAKVDLVYTMAGPAYVSFPMFHIQGLSSAYITHIKLDVFKLNPNFTDNIKLAFKIIFQLLQSTRANHFIFQTEAARINYVKRTMVRLEDTTTISNAFDLQMKQQIEEQLIITVNTGDSKRFTIFCPGAPFIHKAFHYIPHIAKEIKTLTSIPFTFVLTLPESSLLKGIIDEVQKMGLADYVSNIGPYDYSNISSLYRDADIVFVPSLLETFSSTYLEAMIADKILVVSDKEFAREICGDEAYYVDPRDYKGAADVLSSIIVDPEKLLIPDDMDYILAVGRLETPKNFSFLIQSFKEIKLKNKDLHLVILGTGSQEMYLRRLVAELGLDKCVHMLGFVSDPNPYFLRAKVFVLSSLQEGFGNVIIEALANGTPVVSTDCPGGPKYILEDGKFGRMIKSGDINEMVNGVTDILDGRVVFNKEELIKRAADFGIERIGETYLMHLKKVM